HRADIMFEAGHSQFAGHDPAADLVILFHHAHAAPGLGQIAGGDQAVVATTGDDDVVGLAHLLVLFLSMLVLDSRAQSSGERSTGMTLGPRIGPTRSWPQTLRCSGFSSKPSWCQGCSSWMHSTAKPDGLKW